MWLSLTLTKLALKASVKYNAPTLKQFCLLTASNDTCLNTFHTICLKQPVRWNLSLSHVFQAPLSRAKLIMNWKGKKNLICNPIYNFTSDISSWRPLLPADLISIETNAHSLQAFFISGIITQNVTSFVKYSISLKHLSRPWEALADLIKPFLLVVSDWLLKAISSSYSYCIQVCKTFRLLLWRTGLVLYY